MPRKTNTNFFIKNKDLFTNLSSNVNAMNHHLQNIEIVRRAQSQSQHPTYKVGALIVSDEHQTAKANFFPDELYKHFGENQKLGNASITVHAEIAAMLEAPKTDGASLYVTDLPCPNCAKSMTVAGIQEIYIDENAFESKLGKKMKPFFEDVSLTLLTHAGIQVSKVGEEVTPLNTPKTQRHKSTRPAYAEPESALIEHIEQHQPEEPFAACFASDHDGKQHFLYANANPTHGLDESQIQTISQIQTKYKPVIKPINQLLMLSARHGLEIDPNNFYSSQAPTSREWVNLIGAGLPAPYIENPDISFDEWGLDAMKELQTINLQKKSECYRFTPTIS